MHGVLKDAGFIGGRFVGADRGRGQIIKMATYKVVMVRHGESAWNKENRFCGWFDADLAPTGEEEAKNAGKVSFSIRPVITT